MSANEKLQSLAISQAVDLQHYSNSEVRKMMALLNRVDADLTARLEAAVSRLTGRSFSAQHMASVLTSVRELNREIYTELGETLKADLSDLAQFELDRQAAGFTAAIPAQVLAVHALAVVNIEQVKNIAFSRPFQGRLLSEWLDGIETGVAIKIRDAIRIGMVEGQTTSQIVQRIRGTRAEGYADGLLSRSKRDVETIVRSAISHVASTGRDAFYDANADLIKASKWTSTLDGRTTPACRIRDGLQYTPIEHKPIGHKVPWLSGPGRLHMCCRSTSVPVTKSWKELGLDFEEISPGTRASMDGQVPADTTYADWLKGQSAVRQDQILGPTRGKLYRDGKLPMDRFYNDKGRYLTLDELIVRDQEAFKAANIRGVAMLKNADKAVIDIRKLTQYALNPEADKNKAEAFRLALGYDLSHAEEVRRKALAGAREHLATKKGSDHYGDKYEVHVPMTGPAGSAVVLTGWIFDPGSDVPRLTSIYVDKRKN